MKLVARLSFLLLAPIVPLAQARTDGAMEQLPSRRPSLYLESGSQVRMLLPGLADLMGSIYWLRAVQYYGHQRAFMAGKDYSLLAPLIQIAVDLDPRMEIAYRYGAIFISEPLPTGAGAPEEGVRLLERGARALPASWRIRWDLGSLWFFFLRDDVKAAAVLLDASKVPGAPFWLESLAASVLGKGGHRKVALEIWKSQYEHSTDGAIRDNALYHIQQIDALDAADSLTRVAEEYARREGHSPASPKDLVAARLIARISSDPSGVPFQYDPQTGRFSIARGSKFWRARYDM